MWNNEIKIELQSLNSPNRFPTKHGTSGERKTKTEMFSYLLSLTHQRWRTLTQVQERDVMSYFMRCTLGALTYSELQLNTQLLTHPSEPSEKKWLTGLKPVLAHWAKAKAIPQWIAHQWSLHNGNSKSAVWYNSPPPRPPVGTASRLGLCHWTAAGSRWPSLSCHSAPVWRRPSPPSCPWGPAAAMAGCLSPGETSLQLLGRPERENIIF
jgi:hypothetical protein